MWELLTSGRRRSCEMGNFVMLENRQWSYVSTAVRAFNQDPLQPMNYN